MKHDAFGYDGPRWTACWYFVGWDCISLGVSVCVSLPNIEVHLPFSFIRIGRKAPPPPGGYEFTVPCDSTLMETRTDAKEPGAHG